MIPLVGAVVVMALGAAPSVLAGQSAESPTHRGKRSSDEKSVKAPVDRGKPGTNSGAQVLPPGEGEQTGRPGTMFGAPPSLPAGGASGYEGADQEGKGQT
jgi:hypothetical protein